MFHPPIVPTGENESTAGPTLMKGVAKPNCVYTIPLKLLPIKPGCTEPGGPAILSVPGPIKISLKRKFGVPIE